MKGDVFTTNCALGAEEHVGRDGDFDHGPAHRPTGSGSVASEPTDASIPRRRLASRTVPLGRPAVFG